MACEHIEVIRISGRTGLSKGCLNHGHGLREVQFVWKGRVFHTFITIIDNTMWILHAFANKRRRIPPGHMTLARKRVQEIRTAIRAKKQGD